MVDVRAPAARPARGVETRIGPAPQRHRRPPPSLGRATALIVTGLAVLVLWGLAAFVLSPPPTEPDTPGIGLPPPGKPDGTASPPVGSPPAGTAGVGPRIPPPPALGPPVPTRTGRPGAVQAPPRPAVPQPEPQPTVPQPAVPQPSARPPAAPEPAPPPAAPEPPPSPAAPPSAAPPSAAPHPGNGKGRHPKPKPQRRGPKVDQRYASCEEVIAAGLGPYKERRDVEYEWYPDLDGDGWACEYSHQGLGRR